MPLDPEYRYNANCFAITPERDSIILQEESDTQETHLSPKNYKVYNIGRTKVFVGLLYGIQTGGYSVTYAVEPGETKILYNEEKGYQTIRLKVINPTNLRAFVHTCTADGIFPMIVPKEQGLYDYDYYKQLKELFSIGVKYVSYSDKKFRALLNAYWPSNKPNIWEQIEVKLQPLIEYHVLDRVRGFLNNYINNIGKRLRIVSNEFENGRPAACSYMNIAMDLTGFEKRLVYTGKLTYYKAINKFLLPLYSNFVLMKITFYTLGIACFEDLGLTVVNTKFLKDQINKTINGNFGATKRIADMYKEWVCLCHDTCHPEDIYNSMMSTRSFIALHGVEHSRIWDNMMTNLSTDEKIYSDVISYSTFFGRPTANLYKESIAETMQQPLTPYLIGNKRNCICSIDIFLWREFPSASPKIGGARIIFENDDVYIMGTITEDVQRIDFNKARIIKLTVTGDGAVDSCTFYMSDNRELEFGTRDSGTTEETFELKDHHIVSFFLSNDNVMLGGQAANIAVAYRLNENC